MNICVIILKLKTRALLSRSKKLGHWMGGWMGGWVGAKARLRIAYSNQKVNLKIENVNLKIKKVKFNWKIRFILIFLIKFDQY